MLGLGLVIIAYTAPNMAHIKAWAGQMGPAPVWQKLDLQPAFELTWQGEHRTVFHDTPHALDYGPALAAASTPPGQSGNTIVFGHRNTHFAMLERMEVGQRLQVQAGGEITIYRITSTEIISPVNHHIVRAALSDQMVLSTCYPFDQEGGEAPLRYVVVAQETGEAPPAA